MALTLFMFLFVSIPEAFLNLIIILILCGERKYLSKSKGNLIRFSATLLLMLLSSFIIRPLVPNVAFNLAFHALAYTVIIKLIYKTNIFRTLFNILLLASTFVTLENLYIPYVIIHISNGLDNFFKSSLILLLCSLPTRIFQIAALLFLKKYHAIINLDVLDKGLYKWFILLLGILIFSEHYFSYIFTLYYGKMSLSHQIFYSFFLFAMIIATTVLIFKLLHSTIKRIISVGLEEYSRLENDAEQTFKEIYALLKADNTNGAKSLLEELLEDNETHTK